MFLLFSSNAERLFQRGILEVLALPQDHTLTFRYQTKYVAPSISNAVAHNNTREFLKAQGLSALIIYAEKPTEECDQYQYCPVRFAEIKSLRLLGDIVFIEVTLGNFANLATWDEKSADRIAFLKTVRSRPGALVGQTGQGHFCDLIVECDWHLWADEETEGRIWQTVVDRLAVMPSMNNCLFYMVRGFFTPIRRVFWWSAAAEPITPKLLADSLVYPIPMSRTVDLKLLFYRPSNALPKTISAIFEVSADKSGFSEVPNLKFSLESRYDEINVRLVAKRVYDNILAPVYIALKESQPQGVLVSETLLLGVVRIPHYLLVYLLISLFVAPILLALSPDDISWILSHFPTTLRTMSIAGDLARASIRLAVYAKVCAGFIAAAAGFVIFRRFPISK
jgi:hypothetical protein